MNENQRVLIVEDDLFQVHLPSVMLRSLNFDVLADTDTGEGAVRLAMELKPRLILMDIALAGEMDGI